MRVWGLGSKIRVAGVGWVPGSGSTCGSLLDGSSSSVLTHRLLSSLGFIGL